MMKITKKAIKVTESDVIFLFVFFLFGQNFEAKS